MGLDPTDRPGGLTRFPTVAGLDSTVDVGGELLSQPTKKRLPTAKQIIKRFMEILRMG